MANPSPGCSITVRVEAPASVSSTAELAAAVGRAGAAVTALDVVESRPSTLVVDVTCDTTNADHGTQVQEALAALDDVTVLHMSDRTFLMHLGGKLEIVPKVPLRNRDDLSRAYTPGVARVCLAIAEHPEDARNLTVKRNTIAVVTDGSAVLGLGNIGPLAALPVMEGKAALFKQFADVDAWPVCLDTQDTDEIIRIVVSGVGAAGSAIIQLLKAEGAQHVIAAGRSGVIHAGERYDDEHRRWLAANTNAEGRTGTLAQALAGADVFIGVSAPNVITESDVQNMADDAIVFAMANPDPEIDPVLAARHAAVVATGRSDFPNQINNVLAFPGFFRGLLDAHAVEITPAMLVAAADAIAKRVSDDELHPSYIIPSVFDPQVAGDVAAAVAAAARADDSDGRTSVDERPAA